MTSFLSIVICGVCCRLFLYLCASVYVSMYMCLCMFVWMKALTLVLKLSNPSNFLTFRYPRIRLAIEHNHKEFVGHMYCQQMLRQEWQGGLPWLGKSYQHRIIYSILLNLVKIKSIIIFLADFASWV
jgi:hypothetical protein